MAVRSRGLTRLRPSTRTLNVVDAFCVSRAADVERSIKGPFYFGDAPSAPDFFLLSLIDFNDAKMFDKLKPLTGDVFSLYPKISGVVAALREATPYKEYKGLTIILPNVCPCMA